MNDKNIKKEILDYLNKPNEENNQRNRMGCLEVWYDPYYAMKETFSYNEIAQMSEKEISNLIKLVKNIQDALY